ncbi:sepiapterin reductase [Spirochaetota bacterium]|nr:sepiapterin reductase [Spirochaetota bacterium]
MVTDNNSSGIQRDLRGKTALITGGSKGIGKATALALAEEGVNVILFARTERDLKNTAAEIRNKGGSATFYAGDGTDEKTVKSLAESLAKDKVHVDILINNMGVGKYGLIETFTIEDYDWLMNTNMRSTFLFSRLFVPPMLKRQDGDVIFVASVSGLNGLSGRAIYCATKNAQVAFAEALDYECRTKNVRVSVLAPGGVNTDFAMGTGRTKDMPHLAKMLTSADVASAIHYTLCHHEKSRAFLIGMRPLFEEILQ